MCKAENLVNIIITVNCYAQDVVGIPTIRIIVV